MGYFPKFGSVVVLLLTHSVVFITCIAPRRHVEEHVRTSRTHTNEAPLEDWEVGLREATHQALLREGHADPSLRSYLLSAPFSGKQNVKVFGDIAILARGQLYATSAGFRFVQDPYHNDCDECHNKRKCNGDKCDPYVPYGAQQLLALWTVKRIRHRDINFGYRYEVEYTISPIERALSKGFITKNGNFDYGIPGHVFVIKSNPRYINGYEHNEFYSSPDQVKLHRQYEPRLPNQHFPQILITHSHDPPSVNIPSRPQSTYVPDEPNRNNNLKEIQLYRKLINSLSAKTSTTGHRFKITNTSPRTTLNQVIPSANPTRTTYQIGDIPGRTTLVQLPSGQIVPVTEVSASTTPDGQLQILTPVRVGTHKNGGEQDNQMHYVPSSPITITEVTKYIEADIPHQIPSTKIPIFIMKELIPPSTPSVKPEVVKDMGSTKLPKKTTIHFFAAEDVDKSNHEEKDGNDIFSISTRKYDTSKEFTKVPLRKTSKAYEYENEDDLNLFPAVKPTEAMSKVTEATLKDTSPSYNQISRPYKETATTKSFSTTLTPTKEQQPTIFRRTTIPFTYPSTTETPPTHGTQKTTITLPVPGIYDHQSTTYEIQTSTQGNVESTHYKYNLQSTPRSDATVITVTPVPTLSFGSGSSDGSTLTSYEYTQGRPTTSYNIEHTTESKDLSTDNVLSRTTLVFPSMPGLDDTTYSLGTTQHKNNEVSNTQPYSESPSTTESMFNPPSPNTIITYYGPQTTAYHSTTNPTTETTLVQSTTSPTTKITTTIFKSSKATRVATTKLKPTTNKNIENDFLVEELSNEDDSASIRKNKGKFEDYTDDDIFGPSEPKKQKEKIANYRKLPSKKYTSSFTTEPTRTVAKTPRIIYSDFYEASTVPPTTSLSQFYAESQNNYITHPLDVTTQRLPLTSQSFLTSISYKVNKKPSITDELEVLPTIRAKLSNLHNDEKLQIFRAELPENEEKVTKKSAEKEAFDDIALQLVNHARGLELLNKKSEEGNKNPPKEQRKLKYRRRSYMPKSKKNFTPRGNNKA